MKYGFLTVAAAIPSVRVADLHYNLEEIKRLIDEAERQHVEVVVFPELSLTGYTCQGLCFASAPSSTGRSRRC